MRPLLVCIDGCDGRSRRDAIGVGDLNIDLAAGQTEVLRCDIYKTQFVGFECLKLDGSIVLVGLPGKPYSISTPPLIAQRRSVSGSMIGGMPELQEMLNFCGKHNIVSDIELIDPEYINTAYDRTVASDVKYRFVINASKF